LSVGIMGEVGVVADIQLQVTPSLDFVPRKRKKEKGGKDTRLLARGYSRSLKVGGEKILVES